MVLHNTSGIRIMCCRQGRLTLASFDATDPADYRVEKTTTCNGVSYTTTEHIKLQNPADVADPIKPQANGGDVCLVMVLG